MAELKGPYELSFQEVEEIVFLLKNVSDFDLSGYTRSSLKRRIQRIMNLEDMDMVDLKNALINVDGFQQYFIQEVTVNVTEMFRDPGFFNKLNKEIIPYLQTFPRIKIWSAGCSTGEEVYSLAILLKENNLSDRSFIYGTDINSKVLDVAKKGIYPLKKFKEYSDNFNAYNSTESLSNYYTARYDAAIINHDLRQNILFSTHNLATDQVFNEFQLITCRNVLIYFDLRLQEHVINLFYQSLALFGFLCLGTKETLIRHDIMENFKVIDKEYNIYQKIK
ncbi:protein-glutamate O-methyltransferase CheR [Sphingobacterium daejeonense]|uniref:CheR family methyltransferase n=1 Tax=Sphingobacterium daejeonense TaxID=371142 RepID=UPI0010C33B4E|nr:protein-glutamate O-methyltransferase CheR [Sphingobacterium daejeonense]MCT1529538.1 protein-glutamate O-methyltransferase CheR [Sphingobacterium daejeonense]VTP89976.1 Chemotaxis protein methyltransferase [Sphingobacterium daejeonense]